MPVPLQLSGWHHTAVGNIAGQMFKLNCGVADAEVVAQFFVDVAEDAFAG